MTDHRVVSEDEWVGARRRLLDKEKEFLRLRDQLSAERRELPWVRVEKQYVFEGPAGKETLADLFAGRSQLIVYHFMFAPEWEAGCRGCSFWADNYNGIIPHLNQRDVSLAAVSRAPLHKLKSFAARMGWNFKWVSAANSEFNSTTRRPSSPRALHWVPPCTTTRDTMNRCKTSRDSAYFSRMVRGQSFHVLDLRARTRSDERRLSAARSRSERPRRSRLASPDVVGQAA